MSGPTESMNSIHAMQGRHEAGMALASRRRKQEDGAEGVVSKVPRTSQTLEKMQRNHGNGIASHVAAFSIDKILSPSTKDAEFASPSPTRPAELTKNTARSTPSRDDKSKMGKDFSEAKEKAEVGNGSNVMPIDKWYDTLLWQQHHQQYQQHLAAASAFYHHQQHFHPHLTNIASLAQQQAHFRHVPTPANNLPLGGVPPTFCPRMPGRVHLINCQCTEQMSEQPYFLLTPAGYSIPSPFQSDQHYASPRYCRRRKARTVFTEYQIRGLEDRFVYQQYLSTLERVDLARVLFLTEAQVKTWFQNRRMKQKKLSRDSELPFNDDDGDTNDDDEFDEEDEVGDDLDDKGFTKTSQIAPRMNENDIDVS